MKFIHAVDGDIQVLVQVSDKNKHVMTRVVPANANIEYVKRQMLRKQRKPSYVKDNDIDTMSVGDRKDLGLRGNTRDYYAVRAHAAYNGKKFELDNGVLVRVK